MSSTEVRSRLLDWIGDSGRSRLAILARCYRKKLKIIRKTKLGDLAVIHYHVSSLLDGKSKSELVAISRDTPHAA